MKPDRRRLSLRMLGPGILVAATGVGAGDLATAAFTGNALGSAILWAVIVGAALKFLTNEGIARWQLATGTTLLEGVGSQFGRPLLIVFLAYLLVWSFLVASALASACGVTADAILPWPGAASGKIAWGLVHSFAGAILVVWGGFRLFERVMGVCIAVMFVTVVVTASLLVDDWAAVGRGIVLPTIPRFGDGGLSWTVALLGGVGGTVTVLCYGYWIREDNRAGLGELFACRVDLSVAYALTAVFGLAMVIIGGTVEIEGSGAGLIVALANRLQGPLGPVARWAFLIGAWGAIFSSLLGVWQSVPYLFADTCRLLKHGGAASPGEKIDTRGLPYRAYLVALVLCPVAGLLVEFRAIQKLYAVVGAAFLAPLAAALLILNGWRVEPAARNRLPTAAALVLTILLFAAIGVYSLTG